MKIRRGNVMPFLIAKALRFVLILVTAKFKFGAGASEPQFMTAMASGSAECCVALGTLCFELCLLFVVFLPLPHPGYELCLC